MHAAAAAGRLAASGETELVLACPLMVAKNLPPPECSGLLALVMPAEDVVRNPADENQFMV